MAMSWRVVDEGLTSSAMPTTVTSGNFVTRFTRKARGEERRAERPRAERHRGFHRGDAADVALGLARWAGPSVELPRQ